VSLLLLTSLQQVDRWKGNNLFLYRHCCSSVSVVSTTNCTMGGGEFGGSFSNWDFNGSKRIRSREGGRCILESLASTRVMMRSCQHLPWSFQPCIHHGYCLPRPVRTCLFTPSRPFWLLYQRTNSSTASNSLNFRTSQSLCVGGVCHKCFRNVQNGRSRETFLMNSCW
jgi:hypothetical protein